MTIRTSGDGEGTRAGTVGNLRGLPPEEQILFERTAMKNSLKILTAAGFLGASALLGSAGLAGSAAMAQPLGFSFRIGDVAFAYRDGYYDHRRRWHPWRSARERNWYRSRYAYNYRSIRRDQDRDGIPNRFDRDRDNDGVPNWRDDRPNNPYRR